MCRGWAAGAGRLMTSLKPEALDGARLAQRFPYLRSLDLSHCMHSVTFHTLCGPRLQTITLPHCLASWLSPARPGPLSTPAALCHLLVMAPAAVQCRSRAGVQ